MIKAILLFIKAHAVYLTITAVAAVTIVVGAPIVIENYELEKKIKDNLGALMTNTVEANNNEEIENNQLGNNQVESKQEVKHDDKEPLTFRIEKVEVEEEQGTIIETDENGVETTRPNMVKSTQYKIVPSYNKDVSKWTRAEKEKYAEMLEQIAELAEAEYKKAQIEEQLKLQETMKELEEQMSNDWVTRELPGAGKVEYSNYALRVKGTVLGQSFDTGYQDFVDNIAPGLQTKLNKRCPVPVSSKDGVEYWGEDGISMEESDKLDSARGFEWVVKDIKQCLQLWAESE